MIIPFNKPYITDSNSEIKLATESILSGHTHGRGPFTKKVEEHLKKTYINSSVFMITSCSHSLEIAVKLLDLEAGDEVIIPSYNFPSAGNAVLLNGLVIKYAPVSKDNLSIDVDKLEELITEKTKCVIPVHYAGNCCNMDKLMKLSSIYNFYVVEDAAQGIGANYKGKPLGSIGHIGCISFHGTKNVISGEGGALIINDKNSDLGKAFSNKAEIIIEKGTNRSSFMRSEIAKYEWVSTGSSFVPSDILMAVLYSQLLEEKIITNRRREIYDTYFKFFSGINNTLVSEKRLLDHFSPKNNQGNGHIFYIVFKSNELANEYIKNMKDKNIDVLKHFVALHTSEMGKKFLGSDDELLYEENLSSRLVRLPIYPDLSEEELEYILKCTDSFLRR